MHFAKRTHFGLRTAMFPRCRRFKITGGTFNVNATPPTPCPQEALSPAVGISEIMTGINSLSRRFEDFEARFQAAAIFEADLQDSSIQTRDHPIPTQIVHGDVANTATCDPGQIIRHGSSASLLPDIRCGAIQSVQKKEMWWDSNQLFLEATIAQERAVIQSRKRGALRVLDKTYARTAFPSPEERIALAKMLDISPTSVHNWFLKKRESMKHTTT
ncbi:hypothetical protein DFH07DRAFT_965317 [Mycena maculata]|uniref:Homeobox domain-containing protein n=1 Tax=Mycena maculata TaxID=230809 RepID=A0AAD7IFC2_9AGAR|nr:hypothetical protein DFH07DRAFT_965317 [Mycena maculata]